MAVERDQDEDELALSRALNALHALIGTEVDVDLWVRAHFLAVGFRSRLSRVEAGAEGEGILVHFENGVGVDLAPGDQAVEATRDRLTFSVAEEIVLELHVAGSGDEG